jgi:hypothetical protein
MWGRRAMSWPSASPRPTRGGEHDPEALKLTALKAFDRWITEVPNV